MGKFQQRTIMAGRRSVRLGPAGWGAMGWGQAPALHYSQGLWISAAVAPTTPSLDSGPVSESGTCFRRNHHGVGEAT